ncbi:MAG: nitronate monooxygenase [Bacteroidetes bacterium]|nr:nitronate monooxygenase [Bacteroidota bacterium]MBL0257107.1 nitronate monooxygenase [Bacteroidota bacterium]MBP6401092.1 nitronate monooxygenase [Bacteroidia bacterium]MBP6648098.1 nitronate monooxygenase [Bacteroidia bacterium]
MHFQNDLTRSLNIRFPLIVAPMFLVTNEEMLKASMEAGIMGCFPSLNYRTEGQLDEVLKSLNKFLSARAGQPGTYAVNLIVQKSNPWFEKHLKICIDNKVPVFITSLGNPKTTIEAAHAYGGKVFCDVTNLVHAQKCFDMGCDGFIAVGQGAGGHAGPYPLAILIETLKNAFPDKPVLAAGGIANGKSILSVLAAGASAAYCGTRFIATPEAGVSQEYKNAILDAGMEDIVMTDRISGTPCTIINTEFAKKIGTKQNWFERWMSNNPRTKKYFKMLIQRRGFNWLEDAVKPGNYHSLWCAGQSVELIHEIKPVKEIVDEFIRETEIAYEELKKMTT